MRTNRDKSNSISTHANRTSCPECGTPIRWGRRWLRGTIWDRWPCPECGRVLKLSQKRQLRLVLAGSVIVACAQLAHQLHLAQPMGRWFVQATMVGVLVAAVVCFPFLDTVEVAIDADPELCRRCGYDLRTQRTSKRNRCPECGRSIPVQAEANT